MPNNAIQALCPYCGGGNHGCARCLNGHIEVQLAAGNLYTRACVNPACSFENGGRIAREPPADPPGECVLCGACTVWRLVASEEEIRTCDAVD